MSIVLLQIILALMPCASLAGKYPMFPSDLENLNRTVKFIVEDQPHHDNFQSRPFLSVNDDSDTTTIDDDETLDMRETVQTAVRHWCDLSGVWISDDGAVLLTLGFPSGDNSQLTGYITQVSVDMTPGGDHSKNWRRRKRRHAKSGGRKRRMSSAVKRKKRGDKMFVQSSMDADVTNGNKGQRSGPMLDDPHFPPPGLGASGIPAALTNRTTLQGSAVSRSGPFAVVTRHGWGAVGTMIGQCQVCGGLDTIVARFYSEVEVFACQAALWGEKSVKLMFRKWADRMILRGSENLDDSLETRVVIRKKQDKRQKPTIKRVSANEFIDSD